MKSVFSVIGLCYAIGLLVAMLFIDFSLFVLCIICVMFVAVSIFYKAENKKSVLVGLLCVCSGIFIYNIFYIQNVKPVQVLCDNTAEVFATVKEKSYTESGKCMYILETNTIKMDNSKADCPQNIKVRIVTKSDFYAEQYEKVKLNLKFSSIPNSAYKFHNISKGLYINAVITSYKYEIYGEKDTPWYSFIDGIKDSIKSKLSENLSTNQSNLLFALLVGDTTDIDKTIISNFRNSGLSHILVISGLHLSIITSFIFGFLSLIFRTKDKSIPALITIIFLLLYMYFTGFSYSVMRSTIMNVIYLFSYIVHKRPNPVNSLGIAIIIITLINPSSIGNISFQMSVMATLGIMLLQKRINKSLLSFIPKLLKENKFTYSFLKFITDVISVSVSATIFTFPIMVFIFEKFSIYFIISNLFVTTLAPFVLSVGIIMLVVSYLPFINILNLVIGFVERALCQFILWISKTVSNLPYSVIDISSVYIKISIIAIILTVAIFFIFSGFKIKDLKYCAVICCSISAMILSIGYFIDFESLYFYIEPTGNGITITEKSTSGVNVLLCGGDNYHFSNVSNFLSDKNINSINIISNKAYYNKYAENINENFDVKNFIFYGDKSEYTDNFSAEVIDNGIFIDNNSKINYNKYSLEIVTVDDKNFIYLVCKSGKIIISPKNGDFEKLPDKYKNVDIAIIQSGCKNQDLITARKVVVCGKQETPNIPNGYYYTGNGEIILYSLFKNEVKLWQG